MSSPFVLDKYEFAEMNIQYKGDVDKTLSMVKRAVRMGYDSVVVNTDIGDFNRDLVGEMEMQETEPPRKKKKKKGKQNNTVPAPVTIDVSSINTTLLEASGKKLRVFSRLTVTLQDSTSVHTLMHDAQALKYDLIAVRPGDDRILQTLSRKGDLVDIITFDYTASSLPFLYGRTGVIQQCLTQGLSFEITYADALIDSSQRRQVLTHARQLLLITKGRNVLLASGGEEILHLRAPFDAANLAILFGARPEDCRKFLAGNARNTLLRAQSRRSLKGAMVVTDCEKSQLDSLNNIPEFKTHIQPSVS